MPEIQQLPSSVVNKIAAGEVIERPASVVKELVENSLDAGSTRIDVTVRRGGAELVRVSDNGLGIPRDELLLAVAPHATSKIRDADDLFRVGTLGFRGEALASMASVSRLTLTSRPSESPEAALLEIVGGRAGEIEPTGAASGTTIEVAQLFFNTPVRRKYLRTTQTEMGHVSDTVTRLALAHSDVHFTLRHAERLVYDLPAGESPLARISRLFGRDLSEKLIAVESTDENVRLSGYVAHPSHSRGNARSQYLFLNGRTVRDRSLSHALAEAYRGLLLTGRYPIAFLRFEMPPELVDVNVHPTKQEVRFQDGGRIYSQLLATLRTKFLSTDLSTSLDPARAAAVQPSADPNRDAETSQADQSREDIALWAREQLNRWDAGQGGISPGVAAFRPFPDASDLANRRPLEPQRLSRPVGDPDSAEAGRAMAHARRDEASEGQITHATDDVSTGGIAAVASRGADTASAAPGLQVHNRYLVAESDEGVVVIDQHALHERILYEHLRERTLAGELETQSLLVPEPVDLSPAEAAAALTHQELLAKLGLKVEPFGGDTVLLSSYPAMLANLKPSELLRNLVEQLLTETAPQRRDLFDEMLHSVACRAAIKAGDRLTPEEITALLEQRHLVSDAHHCPHGRPTALVFTREELDRQFKRT